MIVIQRPDSQQLFQALRMRMKLTPLDAKHLTDVIAAMFEAVCVQAEQQISQLESRTARLEQR
jgi:hypothetical protein